MSQTGTETNTGSETGTKVEPTGTSWELNYIDIMDTSKDPFHV